MMNKLTEDLLDDIMMRCASCQRYIERQRLIEEMQKLLLSFAVAKQKCESCGLNNYADFYKGLCLNLVESIKVLRAYNRGKE